MLKRLKSGWMAFVEVFGRVQATVLLTLVYHISVGPIALGCRLLRRDLLGLRGREAGSYASPLPSVPPSLERARKQF
jgi:hypothetical protein